MKIINGEISEVANKDASHLEAMMLIAEMKKTLTPEQIELVKRYIKVLLEIKEST